MNAKTTPKKRKAAAARQAGAWTRREFVASAKDLLAGLMVLDYEARFAVRSGHRRPVRGLSAEFDRRLAVGMMELLTHPLRRSFDRRSGFETVIEEMSRLDAAVRTHLNAEFTRVYGTVTRPLNEPDTEAFWMRVRQEARMLGAAGERSP
jgi:hypothetical protein